MSKPLNIVTWVIQGILALMIGGSGASKLFQARWIEQFTAWGYPDHFVYIIGILELAAAIAMFVRPVMSYGSILCAAIMIGATTTHLTHAAGAGTIVGHVVIVSLLVAIAFARRPPLLRSSVR